MNAGEHGYTGPPVDEAIFEKMVDRFEKAVKADVLPELEMLRQQLKTPCYAMMCTSKLAVEPPLTSCNFWSKGVIRQRRLHRSRRRRCGSCVLWI